MKSILVGILYIPGLILLSITILLGWELITRITLDYNAEGRYFDEANAMIYHEQAIPVYGLIFMTFIIASIVTVRKTIKSVSVVKNVTNHMRK